MTLQAEGKYYKKDFWSQENLKYAKTHFRLEKVARVINRLASGREVDLLDVGCGPALLTAFLQDNIHYHGIDIAIPHPAPYLLESDFVETPIYFHDRRFDIILAQGVFEYIGAFQSQKFAELSRLLKDGGTFIASYVNFNHRQRILHTPYNNVQSFDEFRKSLSQFFRIDRVIPTSHRWHHWEPTRYWMKAIHMYVNTKIPFISSRFAVQYLFICRSRESK